MKIRAKNPRLQRQDHERNYHEKLHVQLCLCRREPGGGDQKGCKETNCILYCYKICILSYVKEGNGSIL